MTTWTIFSCKWTVNTPCTHLHCCVAKGIKDNPANTKLSQRSRNQLLGGDWATQGEWSFQTWHELQILLSISAFFAIFEEIVHRAVWLYPVLITGQLQGSVPAGNIKEGEEGFMWFPWRYHMRHLLACLRQAGCWQWDAEQASPVRRAKWWHVLASWLLWGTMQWAQRVCKPGQRCCEGIKRSQLSLTHFLSSSSMHWQGSIKGIFSLSVL